jgi:hypothetical protein
MNQECLNCSEFRVNHILCHSDESFSDEHMVYCLLYFTIGACYRRIIVIMSLFYSLSTVKKFIFIYEILSVHFRANKLNLQPFGIQIIGNGQIKVNNI